jgi:hypothetical protein
MDLSVGALPAVHRLHFRRKPGKQYVKHTKQAKHRKQNEAEQRNQTGRQDQASTKSKQGSKTKQSGKTKQTGKSKQSSQGSQGNRPMKAGYPKESFALGSQTDQKMSVVLFLNRAEHAKEEIYSSAVENAGGKKYAENGRLYRELPERFDSKEKIVRHFSQYWSRPLSESLYNSMSTKQVNGKLYVSLPETDSPVLISVRNTSIRKQGDEVHVVINQVDANRSLAYQITPDKQHQKYKIISRSGS